MFIHIFIVFRNTNYQIFATIRIILFVNNVIHNIDDLDDKFNQQRKISNQFDDADDSVLDICNSFLLLLRSKFI